MNDDELVEAYSTGDSTEAEILRIALESEGIRCEVGDENQGGLTGLDAFEIKVLVRAADLVRAQQFIAEHQKSERNDE